jgi:hypothetical protein
LYRIDMRSSISDPDSCQKIHKDVLEKKIEKLSLSENFEKY